MVRDSVLLSDKEGGFVVLPNASFNKKASDAIEKNFKVVSEKPLRVRMKALKLLKRLNLESLEKAVRKSKGNVLSAFFTVKTHKPEYPMRTIVTETGSWQKLIGRFLQRTLKNLTIADPFGIDSSKEVIDALKSTDMTANCAFSVDIEELYQELFVAVHELIECNGEMSFQSSCGLSTNSFMELLMFYLQSTFIDFDGKLFLQKNGVCIGSCVAPILCNIYLAKFDNSVCTILSDDRVSRIFRYVDDFLILLNIGPSDCLNSAIHDVMQVFQSCSTKLCFTHEAPLDNSIRFLDLSLTFLSHHHICWMYSPRTKKTLLPYESSHSKLVKRAIANLCISNALEKSCTHQMLSSFNQQVERLLSAGYSQVTIEAVAESLHKKKKQLSRQCKESEVRKQVVVMPYLHGVSHNLKKVAARNGVKLVFSAPCTLSSICKRVAKHGAGRSRCNTAHVKRFSRCETCIVYRIPLTCGREYIGQSGRCVNDRMREHANLLPTGTGGNLQIHGKACGCDPLFSNVLVTGKADTRREREIIEAYQIYKLGPDKCVSAPSVFLNDKELWYLDSDSRV